MNAYKEETFDIGREGKRNSENTARKMRFRRQLRTEKLATG